MKWFYNLKVVSKLILVFVLIALIAGVVGIVGISNIKLINKADSEMYEYNTVPISGLSDTRVAYQRIRVNLRDIIIEKDITKKGKFSDTIKELDSSLSKSLDNFDKSIITEDVRKEFTNLKSLIEKFNPIKEKIINYSIISQEDQAAYIMNVEGLDVAKEVEASLEKLGEMKVLQAKEKSENNTKTANTATYTMILIIAFGMLLAISIGIFTSKSICNPLKQLVDVSEKIAEGDLSAEIVVGSNDETGMLAKSFSMMSDNLNDVMANIISSSEQVAAGSKQVSEASISLSQGATEQASSIEELTASLEEISSQTKLNAENANEANELARTAKVNAEQGNNQMKEMLKAMEEINESSSNISKIIKVIDEIAFQTNILALNAAVEAARAGEHGKGFAVVAEEVRNLAARSASAAKETTDMIEGSIRKVKGGTEIADETAEALNKIVEDVSKAASLVGNIAVASNEQASGIAQINQGIMQVSQVVQTNSSTSEESAAASEELSSQAELLREAVNMFKLKKSNASKSRINDVNNKKINPAEDVDYRYTENMKTNSMSARISLSDKEFGKY